MELREIIAESFIQESNSSSLFGNNAPIIVSPETEEDIVKVLTYANTQDKKVSVISGGTKRGYGGIQGSYDIVLSLANFKGVIEHTVGDMTITVKPGTTIKEIREYLKQHNQMISLDPAWPDNATIGGVIAANESGPKRLRYGSARDCVIGMRVAYPDGRVIRAGGKVVKNVAGYDMNKLFIGSMGTLGVITEITMKLRPIPKYESLVVLTFTEEQLEEIKSFVVRIQDSMMEPVSLELVNPTLTKRLFGKDSYSLLLAFEDVEKSVLYQEEWVDQQKPASVQKEVLKGNAAIEFWTTFAKIAPNSLVEKSVDDSIELTLKIGSKNMDVFSVIKEAQSVSEQNGVALEAHGGLGHGLSHVYATGTYEQIRTTVQYLRQQVAKVGGYVVIKHLPFDLREELNVWGDKPTHFFLLEGIKRKVDPKNTLNQKRFVGGI